MTNIHKSNKTLKITYVLQKVDQVWVKSQVFKTYLKPG